MAGRKVTRDDLREAAEKYKNWGKWGPDDEIGTLNYTSPTGEKGQGDFACAQFRQ